MGAGRRPEPEARAEDNLRSRVIGPAIARLEADDRAPLPERLTPHGLRHTFASILIALGEDPRYVMAQIGHTDPTFTLRLYTHLMRRDDDDRERLAELVGRALSGTNGHKEDESPLLPALDGRA